VYSKLWGNYSGLQNTDEIRAFVSPSGSGFAASQQFSADIFRGGGNANRVFDLDQAMFDAQGNLGLYGRLPTDRPHVFKFYGSKVFGFGTEIGGFFRASSGTPLTTQVITSSHIPFFVNGRGDYGRTPVFSNTDLLIAHEFKFGEDEVKRLRLEFNAQNIFNQKIAQYVSTTVNFDEFYRTAGINVLGQDFSKGFNWEQLLAAASDNTNARGVRDPRYGMEAVYSPGFSGRLGLKFIF
jgi:hypothetical protein